MKKAGLRGWTITAICDFSFSQYRIHRGMNMAIIYSISSYAPGMGESKRYLSPTSNAVMSIIATSTMELITSMVFMRSVYVFFMWFITLI